MPPHASEQTQPTTQFRPERPESGSRTRNPESDLVGAQRRVSEYLRAMGLFGPRVEALSVSLVHAAQSPPLPASPESSSLQASPDEPEAVHADAAVALAQQRFDEFLNDMFGERAAEVDPLWLRAFFQAYPESFLGDIGAAREAAERFGNPWEGTPPAHARFSHQSLKRLRVPQWLRGLWPPALFTTLATSLFVYGLSHGGLTGLGMLWAGLFSFLFGCASVGFFTALRGFWGAWRALRADGEAPKARSVTDIPRSVVVMPVYHEDAERVFAAVAAMRESLAETPGGQAFEIFVLSDSRKPERVAEEERAWRRIVTAPGPDIPVYYRRRARNTHQKAGNLAEFLERWGDRYTYAVVLDADSLMRGATMVSLVRRMEAAPRLGLLQAPLSLHGGATWFARAQQFAASVCGPIFTRGLASWSGGHGNYYGHNAAIRVDAFLKCCALPTLAGKPPLGGHILSHDFVEAALLCRAGWQVRIAYDLEGSWEELPPTLPEYVTRDRRWCQGNLQHLKIAFTGGLMPMSRIHMLTGVALYLAGPLWFAFVLVGLLHAQLEPDALLAPGIAITLTCAIALLVVGPRVLGWLITLRPRESRRLHGGFWQLTLGSVAEVLFSAMLAPLMMIHHTGIVLSILTGKSSGWGSQQRRGSAASTVILRAELPATLVGLAMLAWLGTTQPSLLWPLVPIWLPLTLAIPLALLASSVGAGRLAARCGLLTVPSEVQPDPLALRVEDMQALTAVDESCRFRDMVLDPLLVHAQLASLGAPNDPPQEGALAQSTRAAAQAELARLCGRALRGGPTALSGEQWEQVVSDPASLRWLHREAWRHWPVESWDLARERAQLPPDEPAKTG